jgi:chromosome segregation ATPase
MTDREITNADLEKVDRAIGGNEGLLKDLYVLRKMLGEIGRLDFQGVKRGTEAERARLDEVRKQADAATAKLEEVKKQIADKERELREVEKTIEERRVASDQLNENYLKLRSILAAA